MRDEVEEGGQRLDGLVAQMAELGDQLVAQSLLEHLHRYRSRLVRQEVPVVGALQVQLQVYRQTVYRPRYLCTIFYNSFQTVRL